MFTSGHFDLSSADSLIRGFAQAIKAGLLSRKEVRDFVLTSVNGNETVVNLIMEKTEILLECPNFLGQTAFLT